MQTSSFTSSPDLEQLPFLLRLMDDPSPRVREKIAARLQALGASAWLEIENRPLSVTPAQRELLKTILASVLPSQSNWLDWLQLERETDQLEAAFCWLSCQRSELLVPSADIQLRQKLDSLAREYLKTGGAPDPEELSAFLFRDKNLIGASGDNYYTPESSDLLCVLQNGYGLPISLACIFILVGARLDIEIVGCEFPGHFLARAPLGDEVEADLIFDCHDAGRVLQPFEVEALRKTAPYAMSTPATARAIIARVLRNYATAHHVAGNRSSTLFHLNLLQQLEAAKI